MWKVYSRHLVEKIGEDTSEENPFVPTRMPAFAVRSAKYVQEVY